jgi:hypothetical protein
MMELLLLGQALDGRHAVECDDLIAVRSLALFRLRLGDGQGVLVGVLGSIS